MAADLGPRSCKVPSQVNGKMDPRSLRVSSVA